jgi:hypothetical protein
MAIGIYFPVQGMTLDTYNQVHARLSEIGQGEPDGRTSHTGFAVGDGVQVFDVWESPEKFEAFGEHLMPILGELGIDAGQPVIGEVVPQPT